MKKFIECRHPKLPGRTVLMVKPRNGWRPVKKKTSQRPAETDSPKAGASNITEKDEE